MFCRFLPLLFFFHSLLGGEFAIFTGPKTGMHLIVPLLEELTGKKGIWPHEFLNPQKDCDQQTYEILAEDPNYIAYHWEKMPAEAKDFRHELHKAKWKRQFLYCTTPFTKNMEEVLRKKGVKVFTVIRDPRDTIISAWQHYLLFGDGVITEPWIRDLPKEEQLMYFILGTNWANSARRLFSIFWEWQKSDICCTVNFTKLLGLYGKAATEEDQLEELRKIATFLEVKKTDRELRKAFDRAYGAGYTFEKNRVGIWKKEFSEEHLRVIEEELGDIIEEYESSCHRCIWRN